MTSTHRMVLPSLATGPPCSALRRGAAVAGPSCQLAAAATCALLPRLAFLRPPPPKLSPAGRAAASARRELHSGAVCSEQGDINKPWDKPGMCGSQGL